jgi:ABC-type sugar transport system substrate-binding protein
MQNNFAYVYTSKILEGKMKKLVWVMVGVMLAMLFMTACSQPSGNASAGSTAAQANSGEAEPPAAKSYKIGMEVSHLDIATFARFEVVFKEFCDAKGWELISSQNNEDSATMVSNLENMSTAGCDAIFSHNSDPSATVDIYQRIVDAGIVLVSYDAPSDVSNFDFYGDNQEIGYAVGKMAGEWVNNNSGGAASAIVFQAPFAEFMVKRSTGEQAGFTQTAPTAKIADVIDINSDNAADMVENAMQAYPDATVFIFPSDVDSFIAAQVITPILEQKGADVSKYAIFAPDCLTEVVELIAQDTICRGTIDTGLYYDLPHSACEAIAYALTGEGTPYEKTNPFVLQPITIANASEYLASIAK